MSRQNEPFEEFLQLYPSFRDENIQDIIHSKFEFNQLEPSKDKDDATYAGRFYSWQVLGARLAFASDIGKLYKYLAGLGKTRTIIKYLESDQVMNRQTYILVSGKKQRINIENEFISAYPEKYQIDDLSTLNVEQKRKKNSILINKRHKILTFHGFLKEVSELTDEMIIEKFSSTDIWIDEIQGIAVKVGNDGFADVTEKKSKKIKKKQDDEKQQVKRTKKHQYNAILRVARIANDVKVLATSQTPIRDNDKVLSSVLNLLNAKAPKLLPGNYNYHDEDNTDIAFRGLISAIDTMKIPVEIIEMGRNYAVDSSRPLILYKSEMKRFQGEVFLKALSKGRSEGRSLRIEQKQSSNIVFPDRSYGKGALGKKYFDLKENKFTQRFIELLDELSDKHYAKLLRKNPNISKNELRIKSKIKAIKNFSVKSAIIIHHIYFTRFRYGKNLSRKGNVFIHEEQVEGSGLYGLSEFIKYMGFEEFDGSTSGFDKNGQLTIQKSHRYCILTSKTRQKHLYNMLALQGCPQNVDGDYLRIFMASDVGILGFSLANVLQIHIYPDWVKVDEEQGIARNKRITSFDTMIAQMQEEGMVDPIIEVLLFRHMSEYKGKSVDREIYEIAEDKDLYISELFDRMDLSSVDLYINCNRLNTSAVGDRSMCNKPIEEMDYSTYDAYYIDEDALNTLYELQKILVVKERIYIEELFAKYRDKLVAYMINLINYQRIWMKDRYGFDCFMVVYDDIITTKRGLNGEEGKLITIEEKTLTSAIPQETQFIITKEVEDILAETDIDNIEKMYNALSIDSRIYLLEVCYPEKQIENTELYDFVMYRTQDVIFETAVPRNMNQIKLKAEASKKKKNVNQAVNRKNLDFFAEQWDNWKFFNNKKAYIHIGDCARVSIQKHGLIPKYLNASCEMRIYLSNENKWRNMTTVEFNVYNKFVQIQINKKINKFGIYPYCYLINNELYVANSHYTEDVAQGLTNLGDKLSTRYRGIVCHKINDAVILFEVFYYFKYKGNIPRGNLVGETKRINMTDKKKVSEIIGNKYKINDISMDVYKLMVEYRVNESYSNKSICSEIQDKADSMDRLIIVM